MNSAWLTASGSFKNFESSCARTMAIDARIAGVNWNWESARVAIVAIDVAFRFPNTIGVAGWMIVKPNEKDLGPEILIELMLRLNDREIVAGRNDAPIEHDKIVFPGSENDSLLDTRSKAQIKKAAQETEADFAK